ncbi:MAG: ATP-binding protein [Planctomycetota bacterium]|nr:ATP-binding protein [Planctomycetota bacterium]
MIWAAVFTLGMLAGGLIAGLTARARDRAARERSLEAERRAQHGERLAELGAMTSGLAHEIKNPLSTIGLNAQLLGEAIEGLPDGRPVPADERQRLVRRVTSLRREVERLRGILTDFLSYAGEVRPDLARADLNGVVEELADFFQPQALQQAVRLRTDLSPGEVWATIDVQLVKQAVLNLMLNAVQAMTRGGGGDGAQAAVRELIIRTERTREGPSWRARVHVIDTGPGIAPEVLGRLFTPYFTTKAGGSGLGLATSRRLIEAQGGRIDVHTEPGKGTDFTVTLPGAEPAG